MKNLLNVRADKDDAVEVLYNAEKHWTSYLFPIIFTTIGLVGFIPFILGSGTVRIIGIVLLCVFFKGVKSLAEIIKTKIYLTKEHITISTGIFGSTVSDIALKKLEGISLSQNFIGRILNFGTLSVSTGEVTQRYIIKNPMKLRTKIINH